MTAPDNWIDTLRQQPSPALPLESANAIRVRMKKRANRRTIMRGTVSAVGIAVLGLLAFNWNFRPALLRPEDSISIESREPAPSTVPAASPSDRSSANRKMDDSLRLQLIQAEIAALEAQRDAIELAELSRSIKEQEQRYQELSVVLISTDARLESLVHN